MFPASQAPGMPGTVPAAVVQAMLAAFHARQQQLSRQAAAPAPAGPPPIPMALPIPVLHHPVKQEQLIGQLKGPSKAHDNSSSDDADHGGPRDQAVTRSGSDDEDTAMMEGAGGEHTNLGAEGAGNGSRRSTRSSTPPVSAFLAMRTFSGGVVKHAPGAHSMRSTMSEGGSNASSRSTSSHRAARRTAKQMEREREAQEMSEGGAGPAGTKFSMTLRRAQSDNHGTDPAAGGKPPRPLFKPPARAPLE